MRGKSGYTLVELLIALAIFSALATSFAVALRQGLYSWKIQKEDQARKQEARTVMNYLARDLRNAIPFPGADFIGSEREITFYKPEGNHVVRVTYRLSPNMNGAFTLVRLRNIVAFGMNDLPTTKSTLSYSGKIRWEFVSKSSSGQDVRWTQEWPGAEGLPLGLRIHLEFPCADGSQMPMVYERILDLPLGGR